MNNKSYLNEKLEQKSQSVFIVLEEIVSVLLTANCLSVAMSFS
jgi:hypothetical protein